MKPTLILEDYCDGCGYFRPEIDRLYADNTVYSTLIYCANKASCAHVARYFKEKEPVKLGELIHD